MRTCVGRSGQGVNAERGLAGGDDIVLTGIDDANAWGLDAYRNGGGDTVYSRPTRAGRTRTHVALRIVAGRREDTG